MEQVVKDSTIIAHSAEYEQKASDILKADPHWVFGDPTERAEEYREISCMFLDLLR